MYIQSGELVIISKGRFRNKIKEKVIKSLRFRIILIIVCAGVIPCTVAHIAIIKAYESRAVSLRTAEIQNQDIFRISITKIVSFMRELMITIQFLDGLT